LAFWFQVQRSKGMLVLRQILPEYVPQRLGLLWAQEDCLVVADGDFFGTFARRETEDELKIPHADPHLYAVGVGFAVVGGLGKFDLGLV